MEKKQIKKAILFILIILCVFLISDSALALNPDYYNPGELQYSEGKALFDKAAPIIKVITDIGIIGSVLALTIIGLKYMLGSTSEQKAQIKQTMLPLICGCLLIVGTFTIVKVFASIANDGTINSSETTDGVESTGGVGSGGTGDFSPGFSESVILK